MSSSQTQRILIDESLPVELAEELGLPSVRTVRRLVQELSKRLALNLVLLKVLKELYESLEAPSCDVDNRGGLHVIFKEVRQDMHKQRPTQGTRRRKPLSERRPSGTDHRMAERRCHAINSKEAAPKLGRLFCLMSRR